MKSLFSETSRMGMPALAMTDHGSMYGAYHFYMQATAAGVKPIVGVESYVTPNTSRFEKSRVRWAEGGENDVSGQTQDKLLHLNRLAWSIDLAPFVS